MKALVAIICLFSVFGFRCIQPDFLKGSWITPLDYFEINFKNITGILKYRQVMKNTIAAAIDSRQIPRLCKIIGTNSVDMVGCDLRFAVFNPIHYMPRPIAQSYNVYSDATCRINERFYIDTPPDFVLCQPVIIDGKYNRLEDARVYRQLLLNYTNIDAERGVYLYKRIGNRQPVQHLFSKIELQADQTISLHENDWIVVRVRRRLTERLMAVIYQEPNIYLTLKGQIWKAPRMMLEAGFCVENGPLSFSRPVTVEIWKD